MEEERGPRRTTRRKIDVVVKRLVWKGRGDGNAREYWKGIAEEKQAQKCSVCTVNSNASQCFG